MIATLMRQNPALRWLPKWVIGSFVFTTFVFNAFVFAVTRSGGGHDAILGLDPVTWLALSTWFLIAAFLGFSDVHRRCSAFDMTLPVPAPTLLGAHFAAVAAAVGGILVAGIAGGVSGGALTHSPIAAAGDLARAFGAIVAPALLAIVALDSRFPNAQDAGSGGRHAILAFAAAIVLVPVILLTPRFPLLAPTAFVVAALVALKRVRSLDPTFTVIALDRSGGAVGEWTQRSRPRRLRAWWLVNGVTARAIYRKIAAPVIGVPLTLVIGMILAGLDRQAIDEDVRAPMIAMAAYMAMALTIDPMKYFSSLDAFPLSRRRVFAMIVVPWLAVTSIGYGIGRAVIATHPTDAVSVFARKNGTVGTRVPLEFCEFARAGEVPENTAPWGEAHEAWSEPVFRGAPLAVYSPYSVPEGSSLDFAALQISRAVETVYGRSIPAEEIAARYLREGDDGAAVLASKEVSLRRDYPGLRRRYAGPMFPVVLAAVVLLWMAAYRIYLTTSRPGRSKLYRGLVAVGTLVGLMAIYVLLLVDAMLKYIPAWSFSGSASIAVRHVAEAFPGGGLLVWVACAAVTAAAYFAVERRFSRLEAVFRRV